MTYNFLQEFDEYELLHIARYLESFPGRAYDRSDELSAAIRGVYTEITLKRVTA